MLYFKHHPIHFIWFPFIVLHELSHFVFLFLSNMLQEYEFKITKRAIGFYTKKEGFEPKQMSFIGVIIFGLTPISPLFLMIVNVLLLAKWGHYINQYLLIYIAWGCYYLFPSYTDFKTLFNFIHHIKKIS